MSGIWQKFSSTFGDPEAAGLAFLIAIGGLVALVAVVVHWLTVGWYAPAVGLVVTLGAAAGICIRDCRRGRWSILSGTLFALWLVATASALACDIWITYGQG